MHAHLSHYPTLLECPMSLQDAAARNAMAGQQEVSAGLTSAQARIKVLEANLAEAHTTVRPHASPAEA